MRNKHIKETIQKICINCRFYNENWEEEWDQKEHSWCRKPEIDILNDEKSEKLGYCKYFIERGGEGRMKKQEFLNELKKRFKWVDYFDIVEGFNNLNKYKIEVVMVDCGQEPRKEEIFVEEGKKVSPKEKSRQILMGRRRRRILGYKRVYRDTISFWVQNEGKPNEEILDVKWKGIYFGIDKEIENLLESSCIYYGTDGERKLKELSSIISDELKE